MRLYGVPWPVIRSRAVLRGLAAAATAAALCGQGYVPPADAASTTLGTCQDVVLPVALAPGLPAAESISGTLCTPLTWAGGVHQMDVLVHGASYNRMYWDWPVDPATYSYVDDTLAAGRATFAYDRLGAGSSSHPLSTLVTITADAYAMHQVISWLRADGYPVINLIGHSVGSIVAIDETAAYHDANRLVVTGLIHSVGPETTVIFPNFYPADLDPEFAGAGLDPGYLTTLPGTRGSLFYSSSADPAIIAYDEAHKDAISGTELAQALEVEQPPATNPSSLVTLPVLVVVGQQDKIFCDLLVNCADSAQVRANELLYYPRAASLAVATIAGTGHDLALHPSAPQSFAIVDQWIDTH